MPFEAVLKSVLSVAGMHRVCRWDSDMVHLTKYVMNDRNIMNIKVHSDVQLFLGRSCRYPKPIEL